MKNLNLNIVSDKDLISKDQATERVFQLSYNATESTKKIERMPMNLSVIIDRSGSMHGGKLSYARKAARHLVSLMTSNDFLSVVTFDDVVDVVVPSLRMTAENKATATNAISAIQSGGSTNLSGGWLRGCQLIADTMESSQLARAILLTDGQANHGITDPAELARHAAELSARGISTSTFGIGHGFDEHLLESICTSGRGNFHYIASPEIIPELFERELGELREIIMRGTEMTLMVPYGYNFKVYGGYVHRDMGNKVAIQLNDIYSAQQASVFVSATIHNQPEVASIGCGVTLNGKDEENVPVEYKAENVLTYASQAEVEAAPANPELMKLFAQMAMADVVKAALELQRRGGWREAGDLMETALGKYDRYLTPEQINYYRHYTRRMREDIQERELKYMHEKQFSHKKMRMDSHLRNMDYSISPDYDPNDVPPRRRPRPEDKK